MSRADGPVRVAVVCGSLRGGASRTRRALRLAADELAASGAEVDFVDLAELDLPFRDGPRDRPDHPGVRSLKERARAADAFLLGSPEYHNSFSGALKNALDLLGADELRGKLFGLLGVGGGEMGAINALGHLRYVVRGVGGWCLPVQVSIANASRMFDGDRLTDPKLEERVRSLATELATFARLFGRDPRGRARAAEVIDRNPEEGADA